jgi:uncharacterized protein
MKLTGMVSMIRIYTGEGDAYEGRPLFEAIVEEARKQGLSGATVLRGPLGYGASSRVHTEKVLRLSEDLPLVIEIIDEDQRIDAFLPLLKKMMQGGLLVRLAVEVCHHPAGEQGE